MASTMAITFSIRTITPRRSASTDMSVGRLPLLLSPMGAVRRCRFKPCRRRQVFDLPAIRKSTSPGPSVTITTEILNQPRHIAWARDGAPDGTGTGSWAGWWTALTRRLEVRELPVPVGPNGSGDFCATGCHFLQGQALVIAVLISAAATW